MTSKSANVAKASFDEIYTQDDPRDYYSILGSLDYAIPGLAKPIFQQLTGAWRRRYGRTATMLDLGSSYGINAALFRFPLSFDMMRRRYASREMMALPSEDVRALDKHYFQAWPRVQQERIVAADVSETALRYAVDVGLADAYVAHDFENQPAPKSVADKLADIDMICSTGAVGYVTEKTFDALLGAARKTPWVVSFCLRMFDYEPIANTLEKAGLVTEKLDSALFVQRRFHDEHEAEQVLGVLRKSGIDPAGLEEDGLLLAELFVSRPREDVRAEPLDQLVSVVSGRDMRFGPRLLHTKREGEPLVAPVQS